MLLGPFGEFDIETLKDLLEARNIKFEIVISDEGLEALKQNQGGRRFSSGPQVIHFEIADDDFPKIASQMEKYGIIVSDSDGSWELSGDDDEGPG